MVNQERVVNRFMNYVRIGSETHFEGEMSRYLAQELRDRGFAIEKRDFKAHITLARKFREGHGERPVLRPFIQETAHIALMESTHVGGKLTYIEIYRKELGI